VSKLQTIGLILLLITLPLEAQKNRKISITKLLKKISQLEQRVDELAEQEPQKVYLEKSDKPVKSSEYEITFPGQYRTNFYSVDNDKEGEAQQNAARLRLRQNIDIQFSEVLSSSVRFQLNHTTSNITNAGDKDSKGVLIRHGYAQYELESYMIKSGLVPVSEYSNEVLFSSGWGYNPFALEGYTQVNENTLHYFLANLKEGDERQTRDDFTHYHIDYIHTYNEKTKIIVTASLMEVEGFGDHQNIGLKVDTVLPNEMKLNALLMHSSTDKGILLTQKEASGVAFLSELIMKQPGMQFSFLVSYASGEEDGSGFLVPLALTKTNSYWGYTGIMTVMAQTDTGFSGDSVNISNNGHGMASIQAKSELYLMPKLKVQVSAGWFGATKTSDRKSDVGLDLLAMGTYDITPVLKLDLGLAYAQLEDSLSGTEAGVVMGSSYNAPFAGVSRKKSAFFGRIQLEF
jgi:hypothetical protein